MSIRNDTLGYVAGPRFKGNGPGDTRTEGDPVPEASEWTRLDMWIEQGHLRKATPEERRAWEPKPATEPKQAADISLAGVTSQPEGLTEPGGKAARSLALLADPETASLSDRELARQVGCSKTLVNKLRRQAGGDGGQRRYRTRHGTETTMDTRAIGRRED